MSYKLRAVSHKLLIKNSAEYEDDITGTGCKIMNKNL